MVVGDVAQRIESPGAARVELSGAALGLPAGAEVTVIRRLGDFDGNGTISALDLARVRSRLNAQF